MGGSESIQVWPFRAFLCHRRHDVLLSPGEQLDARYRVTELLGRGGMGEVWAGEGSDGPVAIKVLLERAARRKDIQRRFEREAEAVSRIRSPFVCALLDQGFTSDGSLFLVFELLQGESLADRLRRELFLSFDELAPLMLDVLRGIQDAHLANVLHRDLKPGNIFLLPGDDRERAVILDFGVSKVMQDARASEEPSITAYDGTVGSFAYMAPEQVRGAARVDERADVYGVASVAFRSLTGRLPFEGMSARMVASLKLERPPPSLEQATGLRWPRLLEQFFAVGLSRNPDDRFSSAEDAAKQWADAWDLTCRVRASKNLE
jgi:serine/threonine protein kinase